MHRFRRYTTHNQVECPLCLFEKTTKIVGPLFFAERIVNGVFYLEVMGKFLMSIPFRNKMALTSLHCSKTERIHIFTLQLEWHILD
jgi:hypothetical protein